MCLESYRFCVYFFFFQAEDGIRDLTVTGVQTCALPISNGKEASQTHADTGQKSNDKWMTRFTGMIFLATLIYARSEEHTSELQSQSNLVCRLLLEKKKKVSGIAVVIHA